MKKLGVLNWGFNRKSPDTYELDFYFQHIEKMFKLGIDKLYFKKKDKIKEITDIDPKLYPQIRTRINDNIREQWEVLKKVYKYNCINGEVKKAQFHKNKNNLVLYVHIEGLYTQQ